MFEKKKEATRTVKNKFGEITIHLEKTITFPLGLPGMVEYKRFTTTPCPIAKFKQFVLLQSLDSDELVFLSLPVDLGTQKFFRPGVLEDVISKSTLQNCEILLIASTKISRSGTKHLAVNAAAPIVIDSEKKYSLPIRFIKL